MKIQKEPKKDQSGINTDFTHVNDYLVSRLGTTELSGLFFSPEIVEKKSANVENGMMRTDCGACFALRLCRLYPSRWGHVSSAGPTLMGFKIHIDLVKILRNVGCLLWVCAHQSVH